MLESDVDHGVEAKDGEIKETDADERLSFRNELINGGMVDDAIKTEDKESTVCAVEAATRDGDEIKPAKVASENIAPERTVADEDDNQRNDTIDTRKPMMEEAPIDAASSLPDQVGSNDEPVFKKPRL